MKSLVKITLILVCTALFVYLCSRIYKKGRVKNEIERSTALLPAYSFTTQNNADYTSKDAQTNTGKIIFNHFSPTCEHCQYMVKSYLTNKEKLKDAIILMVTIADSASVAKFSKEYQITSMPNIVLLRDTKYQFEKTFGTSVVPSFFIYKNNKLVKKIIGETKIDNLLN